MFSKSARFYNAIHSFKDYNTEAARIHDLIQANKQSAGNKLLDVGCGTGQHLAYLSASYDVIGLDIEADLLNIAREQLPQVAFVQAEMQTFDINQSFDVILCLFGSIAYTQTLDGMQHTIRNFYRHLKPGGVCIIEPFLTPDKARPGHPYAFFVDEPDLKLARMSQSSVWDRLLTVTFHYLVGENGSVDYFTEQHRLGLFTEEECMNAMRDAGFTQVQSLQLEEFRRGLYVGVKNTDAP